MEYRIIFEKENKTKQNIYRLNLQTAFHPTPAKKKSNKIYSSKLSAPHWEKDRIWHHVIKINLKSRKLILLRLLQIIMHFLKKASPMKYSSKEGWTNIFTSKLSLKCKMNKHLKYFKSLECTITRIFPGVSFRALYLLRYCLLRVIWLNKKDIYHLKSDFTMFSTLSHSLRQLCPLVNSCIISRHYIRERQCWYSEKDHSYPHLFTKME